MEYLLSITPLPGTRSLNSAASIQGLTPVHFSAQHKRFLWGREYTQGLFGKCYGGVMGRLGCILCQKRLRLS